jgi:hypothetical protein
VCPAHRWPDGKCCAGGGRSARPAHPAASRTGPGSLPGTVPLVQRRGCSCDQVPGEYHFGQLAGPDPGYRGRDGAAVGGVAYRTVPVAHAARPGHRLQARRSGAADGGNPAQAFAAADQYPRQDQHRLGRLIRKRHAGKRDRAGPRCSHLVADAGTGSNVLPPPKYAGEPARAARAEGRGHAPADEPVAFPDPAERVPGCGQPGQQVDRGRKRLRGHNERLSRASYHSEIPTDRRAPDSRPCTDVLMDRPNQRRVGSGKSPSHRTARYCRMRLGP